MPAFEMVMLKELNFWGDWRGGTLFSFFFFLLLLFWGGVYSHLFASARPYKPINRDSIAPNSEIQNSLDSCELAAAFNIISKAEESEVLEAAKMCFPDWDGARDFIRSNIITKRGHLIEAGKL